MSGEPKTDWKPLTNWEDVIEHQRDFGMSAEEIADEFDVMVARSKAHAMRMRTREGEHLDWGTLYGRRRIEPLIAAACRSNVQPTEAEVRAKEAELKDAGLDHGVGSIARALNTSETTVRRRLRRLG